MAAQPSLASLALLVKAAALGGSLAWSRAWRSSTLEWPLRLPRLGYQPGHRRQITSEEPLHQCEVMTLPQSGRLDGGEQPQGLPDARAQRLFEVTFCIPALGIELFLVAARTTQVLFCTSHRGECITSRPEGFAVAMALATPNCRATAVADVPWREPTTSATAFVPGLPACTTLNLKAKP